MRQIEIHRPPLVAHRAVSLVNLIHEIIELIRGNLIGEREERCMGGASAVTEMKSINGSTLHKKDIRSAISASFHNCLPEKA